MDIGFTEEQELLRETARRFLDGECPSAFVRRQMAEPDGVPEPASSREFWRKLAEQGWLGILYPEEYGGSGLGLVDLSVLMEEMGRAVMPGPYLSTVLLGGASILEAGSPAQRDFWLPRIAAGEARATLAVIERDPRWIPAAIEATAERRGDGYVLCGLKRFVPDAHISDILMVAARTREARGPDDGIGLFLVPREAAGLSIAPLPAIDATRKLAEITLDRVRVPAAALLGSEHGGWPALARVIDRATVALCAEMCGGAQRVLEMTADYAKFRIAFGKPIGSYQGVKHKAADMLVDLENAKSLTYYAAWAADQDLAEAPLAASMAKAFVSDAYRKIAGAGIQLHGGIGFTWEHDLQLYFKRAKACEVAFGDASHHRERVARLFTD